MQKGASSKPGYNINFFDISNEADMQDAEKIQNTQQVEKREIVNIPYLMLVWKAGQ